MSIQSNLMTFAQASGSDKTAILAIYRSAIGTEGCTWSMDYPNEEILQEDYRNQGLARELLRSVMEVTKKRGYKSVHFLVSKTNYKALHSYAKLNFIKKDECDLYGEHWWCYEKEL